MNEKEQKQQNNMMKTTVGVTVGKIVEASTTKDVDQSLIEVKEELNEFFAKEEKNKVRNIWLFSPLIPSKREKNIQIETTYTLLIHQIEP